MIDNYIYYNVTFGVLSIQLSLKKYELFNSYFSGIHNLGAVNDRIEELKEFQQNPKKIIDKYYGPGEHTLLGKVDFIGGNDSVGRIHKDGKIILVDNRGRGLSPLSLESQRAALLGFPSADSRLAPRQQRTPLES